MNIDENITLSEYNINWQNQYNIEKELIQRHFPNIYIEHIGSTSVNGMIAKPIIDIMLGDSSYPPSDDIIITLEKLGYYNFGEIDKINGRIYFVKRGNINYNIHVIEYLGKLWNDNIFFRNYLRENKNMVLDYSNIKQNILNKGIDTLINYSKEKENFIKNIIIKNK